jgi:hypothetical protein
MPCYATLDQNLIRKDFTLYDLFKMQPNALLIWKKFIIAKSSVTSRA